MRKSRFSTEQIAQILAHAESGVPPIEDRTAARAQVA